MPEQEPMSPETQEHEPTLEKIFYAVEKDIPQEDLESMKEKCEGDLRMTLGAIFTYYEVFLGLGADAVEDKLAEKGIYLQNLEFE